MNHQAHEIEHARFLRDWQDFIDRWVTKVVIRRGGGTAADADDVRQTAYMEGTRSTAPSGGPASAV